jgi:hypothetical protein
MRVRATDRNGLSLSKAGASSKKHMHESFNWIQVQASSFTELTLWTDWRHRLHDSTIKAAAIFDGPCAPCHFKAGGLRCPTIVFGAAPTRMSKFKIQI